MWEPRRIGDHTFHPTEDTRFLPGLKAGASFGRFGDQLRVIADPTAEPEQDTERIG
jgi:hypothetical protein